MRVVFAGTPEPAVVALEKLIASDHEVLAVITRPDAPRGRGRTLRPSPVSALAQEHGIEVLTPTTLKAGTADGDSVRARLAELAPECLPVVAYGNLIPADLLDAAPHGWVNLHFSLLPRWRGAAPVQAAIAAGDASTGASIFRIDEGLDTGEVLAMQEEEIGAHDTADDLLTRLAYAGADLLAETLSALEAGEITPRAQEGEASHAPKISKEDARIDWQRPAAEIDRHIRAHTPGPGAWSVLGEQRFKIAPISLASRAQLAPGQIEIARNSVFVGTGEGDVELGKIQPPGKKMMDAPDWARGINETEGLVWQ